MSKPLKPKDKTSYKDDLDIVRKKLQEYDKKHSNEPELIKQKRKERRDISTQALNSIDLNAVNKAVRRQETRQTLSGVSFKSSDQDQVSDEQQKPKNVSLLNKSVGYIADRTIAPIVKQELNKGVEKFAEIKDNIKERVLPIRRAAELTPEGPIKPDRFYDAPSEQPPVPTVKKQEDKFHDAISEQPDNDKISATSDKIRENDRLYDLSFDKNLRDLETEFNKNQIEHSNRLRDRAAKLISTPPPPSDKGPGAQYYSKEEREEQQTRYENARKTLSKATDEQLLNIISSHEYENREKLEKSRIRSDSSRTNNSALTTEAINKNMEKGVPSSSVKLNKNIDRFIDKARDKAFSFVKSREEFIKQKSNAEANKERIDPPNKGRRGPPNPNKGGMEI